MSTLALPVLAIPSAGGDLDTYIQSVSRFAFLTQEHEIRYAQRLRDHGDLEAARELVVSHLRLVVAVARGYMGYGLPQADLIQEGNVGLMKAVKRFDPERGVRLASFAMHWIRSEMHDYILRNWRIVKIATTKAQRKLFFNLRSMKRGLNALGSEELKAIARQLGVKTEDVAEMEIRLGGQDVTLEPSSTVDQEPYSPIATLPSDEAEPLAVMEHEQNARLRSEGLEKALDSLDARSRRIIEARWLTAKEPVKLRDLADEFKVSAERIRQIESKALGKMKDAMTTMATLVATH